MGFIIYITNKQINNKRESIKKENWKEEEEYHREGGE